MALIATLASGQSQEIAVPENPDLPSCQHAVPSPPGDDDEASIRLLLDALVRRLQRQPLELAERAVRQGP
jgi:hypothetical protein